MENTIPIGVIMFTPGVFTTGLEGKGTDVKFTSDDETYAVKLTDNGEAKLALKEATHIHDGVTFDTSWNPANRLPSVSGNYYLTDNVTIDSSSGWQIPSGVDIRLCLNGHTIYNKNGTFGSPVIQVSGGTLSIYDEGENNGRITRGDYNGSGVKVSNGTFNLYDGQISGNTPRNNDNRPAGGVFVNTGGKFYMYGGKITENKNQKGGGVYVSQHGYFYLNGGEISGNTATSSGGGVYFEPGEGEYAENSEAKFLIWGENAAPVIQNNKKGNTDNNVYVPDGQDIILGANSSMSEDARIGVTMQTPGVFTWTLNDKGTAENFTSDDSAYKVRLTTADERTEAELVELVYVTITFAPGDENVTNEMEPKTVSDETMYTLPECEYMVEGKSFRGWLVGEEMKQPGDTIIVMADTTVTAVWEQELPMFKTQSLILDGQIGVNFFLDLSALTEEEKADSYMTFDITGKGSTTERDDYDPEYLNTSGDYYGFTCYVNSIQMADTITATFHYVKDGEDKTVDKQYSVKEYIETFDLYRNRFDDETAALVKSLADYGHYVQPFLSETRDWVVGIDYTQMEKYFTESYDIDQIRDDVKNYRIIRKNKNPDIGEITYFLTLDSETAINVYFKPVKGYRGRIKVTVDGETTEAVKSDGQYQVKITNIAAHKLGETHTISVRTNRGTTSVKVSALSYAQGILASNPNEKSQNAAAALYSYFKAADDYLNR